MRFCPVRLLVVLLFVLSFTFSAQNAESQTETLPQAGLNAFTQYQHSDIDSVNLETGNVYVHIPLISFPQVGDKLRMNFIVRYNEPQWTYQVNESYYANPQFAGYPDDYNGVWVLGNWNQRPLGVDVVRDQGLTEDQSTSNHYCIQESGTNQGGYPMGVTVDCDGLYDQPGATQTRQSTWSTNYSLRDRTGAEHVIGTQLQIPYIYTNGGYTSPIAPDGSGWSVGSSAVMDSDGVQYTESDVDLLNNGTTFHRRAFLLTDPHGNQIQTTANGWTDTMGRNIPGSWNGPGNGIDGQTNLNGMGYEDDPYPGVSITPEGHCDSGTSAERQWNVPTPSGVAQQTYWFCYTSVTSSAPFRRVYILTVPADGAGNNLTANLLTKIVLPNGQAYQFHYNSDYLDLSEIDFPTGGRVTYAYDLIDWNRCMTSTPLKRVVTQRSVFDGRGTHTWYYAWLVGGMDCGSQRSAGSVSVSVRVHKPDGNEEVYDTVPPTASASLPVWGTTNGQKVVTYYNGCSSGSSCPGGTACYIASGTSSGNGATTGTCALSGGDALESVYTEQKALLSPFFGTNSPTPDGNGGISPGVYTYQEVFPGPTIRSITRYKDGTTKEVDSVPVADGALTLWEDPGYPSGYYYDSQGNPIPTPMNQTYHGGNECPCTHYPGIAEVSEYNYVASSGITDRWYSSLAAPSASNLLRKTDTSYVFNDGNHSSSYLTNNLITLPSSISVYDPNSSNSGHLLSQTTYSYDETSNISAPAGLSPVQLSSGAIAGDLTTTRHMKDASTWVATQTAYNAVGEVTAKSDGRGNITQQVASWECQSATTPSVYLFPHQVNIAPGTNVATSETYTHDCTSGHILSYYDPNQKTTAYTYNDPLNRLTHVTYPTGGTTGDNGTVGISYTDGSNSSVQLTTSSGQAAGSQVQTVYFDYLGRTFEVDTSTAAGNIKQTTIYDGMGRKYQTSNPFLSTSDATYGFTTYTYDAMSNPSQVQNPDGTTHSWTYPNLAGSSPSSPVGYYTTETDETGISKQTAVDGLGHLIYVNEAAPCAGTATGNTTAYTYDANGNLTYVSQNGPASCGEGSRTRSFAYNALSELIQSTNPETGTIAYSYDSNGNLTEKDTPATNYGGSGSVICYVYDPLNRITSRSYYSTSGCSSATGRQDTYTYGTTVSTANSVGRLIQTQALDAGGMYTQTSGQTYDTMGRLLTETQQVPSGSSYGMTYTYDQMGHVLTSTNGMPTGTSPITFTNSYDSAARLATVSSSLSDSTHPAKLFDASTSSAYGAVGLLNANFAVNNSTQAAAIRLLRSYDQRGRITGDTYTGDAESSAHARKSSRHRGR